MNVILLSHGSRHPQAASGISELVRATQTRLGAAGPRVTAAFLDFTAPALADVARPGDVVVPLLFTDAFHLRTDVPAAAGDLQVQCTRPLGTGADIAALLARRFGDSDASEAVLYAVGSSRAAANHSVAQLAQQISEATGRQTRAAFATRGPKVSQLVRPGVKTLVLPLFVTHGLLLDSAASELAALSDVELAPPLLTDLAAVVCDRIAEGAACEPLAS